MARRPAIEDYPRYGNALVAGGNVVGVLLQIFSRRDAANGSTVRCNISSWCVDKEYRGYSLMLHMNSVQRKEVTYVNISPAAHTRKTIEAFGFRRFARRPNVFGAGLVGSATQGRRRRLRRRMVRRPPFCRENERRNSGRTRGDGMPLARLP